MCETTTQGTARLDTLAQLTTFQNETRSKLRKRARAKYMGLPLVLKLAELDSPLHSSYWNSYHCSTVLEQSNGEITATYCKNRWCIVCNRIRIAKAIRDYLPVIDSWEDPYFVTLTAPAVKGHQLDARLEEMTKEIWRPLQRSIQRSLKRRGKGFKGIRKVEVTYNAGSKSFHPHFHVIVEGEGTARALSDSWMKRNPKASRRAQDVRPCNASALLELFKYFTKLVSDDQRVSALNLDTIFRAMKGRRVFQSFGFRMPKVEATVEEEFELNQSTPAFSQIKRHVIWEWDQDLADWIDHETGECLTEYEPSEQDRAYVEAIDSETDRSDGIEPVIEPGGQVEGFAVASTGELIPHDLSRKRTDPNTIASGQYRRPEMLKTVKV